MWKWVKCDNLEMLVPVYRTPILMIVMIFIINHGIVGANTNTGGGVI